MQRAPFINEEIEVQRKRTTIRNIVVTEPGFLLGLPVLTPLHYQYWVANTLCISAEIHQISMDVLYGRQETGEHLELF